MDESKVPGVPGEAPFDAAEIAALSHLYRGELYRSTVWRTRLDTTTNWAVVSTGLALSLTFADTTASPLPLVLVGLLVTVFLYIEARRYRFFDFWRIRSHILELHFFGPILRGDGAGMDPGWRDVLYQDYRHPLLHITFAEAVGRRLRHNYAWIYLIQLVSYVGKLLIHPVTITNFDELWTRAAVGPIPGQVVLACGCLFHGTWMAVAFLTAASRRGADRPREQQKVDRVLQLARGAPVE